MALDEWQKMPFEQISDKSHLSVDILVETGQGSTIRSIVCVNWTYSKANI